jgi:putative hydrolase of the HAD superfamily
MSHLLTVWDFDGVLNANMVRGRFIWADRMKADLGIDPEMFSAHLFRSGLIKEIIRGRKDLAAEVSDWLSAQGHAVTAQDFMTYWFEQDRHPDAEVIRWLDAHPGRKVIGTNNETHRTAFIEERMGFAQRVEKVFSSGRMGAAKPDNGFFAQIERWAALPPHKILLIDDTAANVAAAKARGWQGFHFTDMTRAHLPARLGLSSEEAGEE